jgi:hypothetical protein
MNLPLNAREAEALRRALDDYLPELEYELARMKRERERHELVQHDELLRTLRNRIDGVIRESEVT